MQIQIRTCKDNLLIVLPKSAVETLEWETGDIVDIEVAEGGLKVARVMTKHDHTMQIARDLMEEYRETLEALAKT